MITIRKSEERGHANHGWLDSYHSFSFADYHDPQHMGFRSLRVINEDRIAGGGGFSTHPHRDMEIITYVISGALQHQDSLGSKAVMRAGDVQRISAGTGVSHSEFNFSPSEPAHLLQIWLLPERRGCTPGYAEKSFSEHREGLVLVASHDARNDSLQIKQDADLLLGQLSAGATLAHPILGERHAWVQVFDGTLQINGQTLTAGDAAAVSDERALSFISAEGAQFLLFDLA